LYRNDLPVAIFKTKYVMSKTIQLPLLRDRHTHPFLYASWFDGLNIHHVDSRQQAISLIADQDVVDGEILIVQGWLDSKFQITADDLESFGPTAVFNLSLHGLVMNESAKGLIEAELGQPGKWSDQIWFERNLPRILNAFAILNGNPDRLQRFYQWLHAEHGVIYAEEMLLAGEMEIEVYREADLLDRTRFWCSYKMWQTLSPESQKLIQGMKIFTDGALGVRTAAVNSPFDNGDCGVLMYSDLGLQKLFSDCIETQKSVAIHAIGDRAIDQVVNLVHRQRMETRFTNEIRIEHAQLISLETARRAKEAGIILSMQPNFSNDSVVYADRLAEHYAVGNNPFRMLIDEAGFVPSKDLIFGSDGMPHGAAAAVNQALNPPYPDRQALTIDELIAGYCDEGIFPSEETIDVPIAG